MIIKAASEIKASGKGIIASSPAHSNLTVCTENVGYTEWEVDLPGAGKWYLHLHLASQDARSCTLTVNGVKQAAPVAGYATGGFQAANLRWFVHGPYDFQQGKNLVRLDYTIGQPALKELAFSPSKLGSAAVTVMAKDFTGSGAGTVKEHTAFANLTVTPDLPAGHIEWKVPLPRGGRWYLHALFTSAAARPCTLTINGAAQAASVFAEVTGGWHSDKLRWFTYGPYDFKPGDNLVRIAFTACQPHLRELAFTPEEALRATGLEDYGYWLQWSQSLPKKDPGQVKPFRRGVIWR